uniref:replication initiation protein n=1 Tax=Priestia megaterium TaxID=1404 RepID=UPI0012B7603F
TLHFHPTLNYLFLHLKQKFTSYQLHNLLTLNSLYSIPIYHFLNQYHPLPKTQLTLQQLPHFLPIQPTNYKHYPH